MSNIKVKLSYEKIIELSRRIGYIDSKPKDELSLCASDFYEMLEEKIKKYNKELARDSRPFYAKKEDDTFVTDDKGNFKIAASKIEEHSNAMEKLLQKEVEISPCKVSKPMAKRIIDLPIEVLKEFNGLLWDHDIKKLYSQDNEKPITAEPSYNSGPGQLPN